MALVIADRVKETTTTTGTGTINLAGAVAAFQTFVAGIGTGNTCYYAITSGNNWEIGLGTVTDASPDTLSRTTILASSAQATATLTFGDTEFDDVNNGTLALIDTAGLSKTYTIRNDYGATEATEFNAGGARGSAAENLAQIVESSNGHNGTIYAMDSSNVRFSSGGYDFSDGVVNFKQATDGSVGNTTITTAASFDNCTDVNIGSAFTGGGSAITLSGTSTVFCTYPADKSVHLDASGNLSHTVDISSDTNLVGGTNITISGDTLNVDDAFLVNDASDTTTGTITAGGFTTTGTWTFDESTSGTIGITTIQDSGSSFSDNDTSLMTSAAIADKITASGGGGGASDIDDLGDVSYGGTNLTATLLINNTPGSAPVHGTLAGDNSYNVGIGYQALDAITYAENNVSIGHKASTALTIGKANVCIGYQAQQFTTEAENSVSIGYDAHNKLIDGNNNVAIGTKAGYFTNNSENNIAIGKQALYGVDGSTSGANYNVAVGYLSLSGITTGDYNTGLGYYTLRTITTGGHNIAIGMTAGANVTEGGHNILLGYQAGNAVTTQSHILAIGVGAGGSATGTLGASIGPYAGQNNTADYATFLGPYAGKSHTSGDYPVYVGHYAGYHSTDGDNNVGIGKYALMGSSGNTTGNDGNTAIGTSALADIRTGDSNTAIGITAGHGTTTGSYNIYVGYRAGYDNTTSSNLLFIGNTDEASNGTLIKGDMANKFLAIGKADVTLSTADATLQIFPNATNDTVLYAKHTGTHTGDLILMENSSGTDLFRVDKDGNITATSITASVSVTTPYTTITGDTTVTTSNEIVFANATSGAIDVTLYLAASNGGKTLTIKKTDSSANAVSILRVGSETIDGATSTTLYHQNEAVTLISDNSNWMII